VAKKVKKSKASVKASVKRLKSPVKRLKVPKAPKPPHYSVGVLEQLDRIEACLKVLVERVDPGIIARIFGGR
jgi:hypothetical protein